MNDPTKLLHVEDDPVQQRLIAHYLSKLTEYRFEIVYAVSEAEAIARFEQGGVSAVLLDYRLKEGDGLSCLRRLRLLDPLVPILAVSGTATPDVAAELLHAGADDFLNKLDLDGTNLASSLAPALKRAQAMRSRLQGTGSGSEGDVQRMLHDLCTMFLERCDQKWLQKLREVEAAARHAHMPIARLSAILQAEASGAGSDGPERMRPLVLELMLRLNK